MLTGQTYLHGLVTDNKENPLTNATIHNNTIAERNMFYNE